MARKRPIGFIFMAIINFVVALFFITCGVCANYSDSSHKWHVEINKARWDEKKLHERLKEKAPAYAPVKITGIVLGYAICVGLILSGVAMLFGGLLAKIFTLLVYAGGFVHHVLMTIYQLVWVHPAMNQFFDEVPAVLGMRAPAEVARAASLFPGYVWITWWILGCFFYLIAAAVVLLCPTSSDDDEEEDSRKSKRSKRRRDESEDDDDDEDDKPVSKKSKRPRGDDDERISSKESQRRRDDDDERPSSKESKRRRDDDDDEEDDDDRKRSRRRRS